MEQLLLPFAGNAEILADKLLAEQKAYCGFTRLDRKYLINRIKEYPHLKWFVYKHHMELPNNFEFRYANIDSIGRHWGAKDSYICNEEGWW